MEETRQGGQCHVFPFRLSPFLCRQDPGTGGDASYLRRAKQLPAAVIHLALEGFGLELCFAHLVKRERADKPGNPRKAGGRRFQVVLDPHRGIKMFYARETSGCRGKPPGNGDPPVPSCIVHRQCFRKGNEAPHSSQEKAKPRGEGIGPGERGRSGSRTLNGQGVFLFLLWPLFARAPRHWFLEIFLLSAPGVQSVFVLLRSVGRRDLSAGPEQKKTPPRVCFFLLRPRGKAGEGEAPLGAGTGPEQKKKHHPGCFFFCCGPGERQGKEKPRWKPARGQRKKKNTTQGVVFLLRPRGKAGEGEAPLGAGTGPEQKSVVFFFALAPCRRPTGLLLPLPFPGAGAKKKHPGWCFFFLLWPRAGAQRGFSFPCLSPGPQQKKKHPGWCFFFCSGPVPAPNGASPSRAFRRGRSKKKKIPWVVCFFLLRPRADAHSLTAGLGGDASPSAGWCFLFCCGPARTGVVSVAPPGRSLTHGGLGRFRQGPGGVFFFAASPPGLFRQ